MGLRRGRGTVTESRIRKSGLLGVGLISEYQESSELGEADNGEHGDWGES